jgi:hypothetical protein
MEAIYTTTGMQVKPYRPNKLKPIVLSRSIWQKGIHKPIPVTAYVMKDADIGKRLCTYRCHPDWLKQTFPDMVITRLPPNHVEPMGQRFTLNPDVMPNDIQASATDAVIQNNFKTAFFNIPTGAGKTLLAIYLAGLLNCKAWIMCFRTIVLEQWKRSMTEMTTLNTERVLIVNSSTTLMKMAEGDFPFDDYDVYLSTPKLLTGFAERHGLDLLNDAMDHCGIGVKFFDEAHYNVGNICKINALTNVPRTYYLSADFGQPDPAREKLYYKMFSSVPVIKPKEELAKSMQYTIGVVVRYNTHPSFNEIESTFTQFGFNHHKFMEYQLSQDAFYHAYCSVLDTIRSTNDDHRYKVLVLCNLIEHVDYLREWTANYYVHSMGENAPNVVRFHSKMSLEEREEALRDGEVIVSTYQSMGVGVDLKLIRYVVSLCPVNVIEDNQAAGRARALPGGEDCYYFLFVDDGFEYVKKRLPNRLGYLQQQKIKKMYSIKYS